MALSIPTDKHDKAVARSRYSEKVEIPLMLVSIAFIGIYSWEVIAQPKGNALAAAEVFMILTWVLFALDFLVTMALTERKDWLKPINIFNFLVVALPMFRSLRILRAISILRIMNRATAMAFQGRVTLYVITSAILLTYLGSLAALDAERFAEDASITNFPDALWWAFITITTVGYGDFFPVTGEGRIVAIFLTLAGICLMGIIITSTGVWVFNLINKIQKEELNDEEDDDLKLRLHTIRVQREEALATLKELEDKENNIVEELESRIPAKVSA